MYVCMYVCMYVGVCEYHTMTDIYTAALLPKKPSSGDDSGFKHGFCAAVLFLQTPSAPAVTHDTIRLCWNDFTVCHCYIHADAVRAMSRILFMSFLLSDGESWRMVKNTEDELEKKSRHQTSIVIQPFLTHCSRRSS